MLRQGTYTSVQLEIDCSASLPHLVIASHLNSINSGGSYLHKNVLISRLFMLNLSLRGEITNRERLITRFSAINRDDKEPVCGKDVESNRSIINGAWEPYRTEVMIITSVVGISLDRACHRNDK